MNYTVAILISFFLCVHHMGGTARLLYMVRNKGVCISYSENNECLIVHGERFWGVVRASSLI